MPRMLVSRISLVLLALACGVQQPVWADSVRPANVDPESGQRAVFRLGCVACHSLRRDGPNGIGPNLFNVVGAAKASHAGFVYSQALRAKGGVWSIDALDAWLTKPSAFAPGTRMSFAGIDDADTRAAVIAYLRSLSDRPPLAP